MICCLKVNVKTTPPPQTEKDKALKLITNPPGEQVVCLAQPVIHSIASKTHHVK